MDSTDSETEKTDALVPATPAAVVPRAEPPRYRPTTIVPAQTLQRVAEHGAVVVATLTSGAKLFDVVVKTSGYQPITAVSQLASVVSHSWIFASSTLALMQNHAELRAAHTDTVVLIRAVVLLLVRRVVKLEGLEAVGNVLGLFGFVKVAGALVQSNSRSASEALDQLASLPIKVYGAVAALLSNAVDERLRLAIAHSIDDVLVLATRSVEIPDRGVTTRNLVERFQEEVSLLRRFLHLRLPRGVDARDVLLEWRRLNV